jgi:hypothetical protein
MKGTAERKEQGSGLRYEGSCIQLSFIGLFAITQTTAAATTVIIPIATTTAAATAVLIAVIVL